MTREFTWGLGAGGGIGGLLNLQEAGTDYSYLYDGKGNVMAVIDGSQSVVASYRYGPFGKLLSKSGTLDQPFTFSTKRYDEKTGLSYYGFRYYNPAIGRWLTRDPLGEMKGLNLYEFADSVGKPFLETNLYQYTGNNPVNWMDPLGFWYIDINFSLGKLGGGTSGIMISPEGIYPYAGGGLVSNPGLSITWSSNDPTPGWNIGAQVGYWIGGQVGTGEGGDSYWEIGFVTPGYSLSGFYVWEPWRWPWNTNKDEESCK